jgi:hypothetical protein
MTKTPGRSFALEAADAEAYFPRPSGEETFPKAEAL